MQNPLIHMKKLLNRNLRDPADKIGACLGFWIGLILVLILLISKEGLSNLTLDGQAIPSSLFTESVLCLLIVGVCVNLTRNLAVGIHDAFLALCTGFKMLRALYKKGR